MASPARKPKESKVTVKELKLVNGIAQGKSKKQAGIDAGYTGKPTTVQVSVSQALKKPSVQEALEAAFIKYGIDIDTSVAPIAKALKATKVIITGQGDQAFAEVVEDIDLQLKGSDRALKLMGIGNQQNSVNINFVQVAQNDRELFDL